MPHLKLQKTMTSQESKGEIGENVVTLFTHEDYERGIPSLRRKLQTLEQEWRASLPMVSEAELVRIFKAKSLIPKKIKERQETRCELVDRIKKVLLVIQEASDDFLKTFLREQLKENEISQLLEIDKHIARLRWLSHAGRGQTPKYGVTPEMIQDAQAVPIESIINQPMRKSGNAYVALCFLHQEKTPSFYVYPESNSFYCFGCHQGGNVINFVMTLHGFDFITAVRWLLGVK